MSLRSRLLLLIFVLPLSCTAALDVPAGAAITCASDRECIDGQRCLLDIRRCVAPSQSCVIDTGDGLTGVTNGSACTKSDGNPGVCISGQCGVSVCGDRATDATIGEECDDGPQNSDTEPNACRTSCKKSGCGDGITDAGEGCDDGNKIGGDGCSATCSKIEVCNDGVVDAGEACDDSNTNPNDGCNLCRATTWDATIVVGLGANGGALQGANINQPGPLAIDLQGNIFIDDWSGDRLWKLDPTAGVATVIGGNGIRGTTPNGFTTHSGSLALSIGNVGMARTHDGLLIVVDNAALRKIDVQTGVINTIAGNTAAAQCTNAGICPSGAPVTAQLGQVSGVVVTNDGFVIYAETNSATVRIIQDGFNYVLAGQLFAPGSTFADSAPGSDINLSSPTTLALDEDNNIYIADSGNHRILKYDPHNDQIHLFAGNGAQAIAADGSVAQSSSIALPGGFAMPMVVDRYGVLYFSEQNRIRKIGLDGRIATVAGDGTIGSTGDGGPASAAKVVAANVTLTRFDELVFTESTQVARVTTIKVRKITNDGVIHDLLATHPGGAFDLGGSPLGTALVQIQGMDVGANGDVVVTHGGPDVVLRSKAGTGDVERVAGIGSQVGDGIAASDSILSVPLGIRLLANGDIYFADSFRHVIRRIDGTSNIITTVVGTLDTGGFAGDNGAATSAKLYEPCDVDVATNGDLYVYDCGNGRIRKVTASTGNISTIIGSSTYNVPGSFCASPASACGDGGPGTSVTMVQLDGQGHQATVRLASNGDVFFSEPTRYRIRVLSASTGNVTTIAGNGTQCAPTTALCGDNGPATSANLGDAGGFFFDGAGLLISDYRLRRMDGVTGSSTISFVGFGNGVDSGDGGPTSAAKGFGGHAVVKVGSTAYFATAQHVRTITSGTVDTVLGLVGAIGDGPGQDGVLGNPQAIALLADDRWVITDGGANRVRVYDSTAQRTFTAVGHSNGYGLGIDPVQPQRAYYTNEYAFPWALAFDSKRNVFYMSDSAISNLLAVSAIGDVKSWTISPFAGQGLASYKSGALATAEYARSRGLAYDAVRDLLWVADTGNHLVRSIDLANATDHLIAGYPGHFGYAGEGGPAIDAFFDSPSAVTVGPDGSVYIADTGNNRVRRLVADEDGAVTTDSIAETVLGDGEPSASGEGSPANTFSVQAPAGLVFDSFGDLWITSTFSVRVITPGDDGVVTGSDRLLTVYGSAPRDTFPENSTACLTGLTPVPGDASVLLLDGCRGFLVRLDRHDLPATLP